VELLSAQNPVLLIHGIDDTVALFEPMTKFLQTNGLCVHSLNLVPNNGDAGLDQLAQQLACYVQTNFAAAQGFDLVGFSMGGIVSRYYVQRLGGIARVQRLITIGSPHNGTWTAYLRWNPGARQMRPGSEFLRDLNSDVSMLDRICFTSIWTPFDLMIVPARSSMLCAGRSVWVKVPAHPLMVRNEHVLRLVLQALTERMERSTAAHRR
jgi:triacylglycerol lipase